MKSKRIPNRSASKRRAAACPRVPVCMLDEARAGIQFDIKPLNQKFAIYGLDAARPIAQRKHQKDAKELIDVALAELSRESGQMTPEEAMRRRQTRIITPQRPHGELAEYQVVEAGRLIPSHTPSNFQRDARYPAGVQEREYDSDENEQRKVIMGAQQLDPAFLLTDTPTATDGPPIVTAGAEPVALGGNGRSMMLIRAYHQSLPGAAAYREALLHRASDFGLSRSSIEAFAHPVLVRVVDGLRSDAPKSELVAAVRRYNEGLTQALSPKAKAIAEAKVLSLGTIEALGELLAGSGDATLRDILRESPRAVVEILERDGVVTPQNRGQWVHGKELLPEAKDRVEGMFLGRVLATGDRYNQTSPSILAKVERAAPWLIRVQGANPAADEIPRVQAALDLLNDAAVHGMTVSDAVRQEGLFGMGPSKEPDVVELAQLFEVAGPRIIGDRFKRWGRAAGVDPRQGSLLGAPPTRDQAFRLLLEETPRKSNPGGAFFFIASRATSMRQLAEDLRDQSGGVPLRGRFVVDRAPFEASLAGGPILLTLEGGRVVRFLQAGKMRSRAAAELTVELGKLGRVANPTKGPKLKGATSLVQSLALSLAAKWKAERKGDDLEARRLGKRAKDLERGVLAQGSASLAQAFKLANTIARRAGIQ